MITSNIQWRAIGIAGLRRRFEPMAAGAKVVVQSWCGTVAQDCATSGRLRVRTAGLFIDVRSGP
jgi:hypothetical protein